VKYATGDELVRALAALATRTAYGSSPRSQAAGST